MHQQEMHDESLALFALPDLQTGIESIDYVEYRPIGQIGEGGALEFNIPGNSLNYINLKKTFLYVKGKIVHSDGSAVPIYLETSEDSAKPALPVNLFLQALWSQVDLSVQQQIATKLGAQDYAYKAYLDALYNTSKTEKEGHMQSQLYAVDVIYPGRETDVSSNSGLGKREQYVAESKIFEMQGPLYLDLCQQDRLLLNGLQVNLRLWPSKQPFRLLSSNTTKEFKFEINEALLRVCKAKVTAGVLVGHAEALKKSPAYYPFDRSVIKTYAIPQGQYSFTVDDLFQGEVPREVKVGLVASEAYSGAYKRDPFNFRHFNCNFAGLYLDGKSVPSRPFEPNFAEGHYTEVFQAMFSEREDLGIDRVMVPHGYCIYNFDLRKESQENVTSPRKTGNMRLTLKFATPLDESAVLVAYAKFPSLMQVDAARNVTL